MKKILFTAVFSVFILVSNAQVEKGRILVGGNFSGGFGGYEQSSTENKINSFSLRPSFGYAYKTNRIAGLSLGYHTWKTRSTNGSFTTIDRSKMYAAGIYLRRYYPLGKGFAVFGQADLLSDHGRRTSTSTSMTSTLIENVTSVGLYLTPGISYNINKRVMIESSFGGLLGLSYHHVVSRSSGPFPSSSYKENSFGMRVNAFPSNALNLGFRIVLGKK